MVKVYFETNNGYSELAATFAHESDYTECLPILEKQCKLRNFDKVTEEISGLYIVHHTFDCQDYNEHTVVANEEEAQKLFKSLVEEAKSKEDIKEIYTEDEDEFYFETSGSQQKIYITSFEL